MHFLFEWALGSGFLEFAVKQGKNEELGCMMEAMCFNVLLIVEMYS